MTAARALTATMPVDKGLWTTAGAIALAAHGTAIALVVGLVAPADHAEPVPVMIVELPPEGIETAVEAASAPMTQAEPQPQAAPTAPAPAQSQPIEIPPTRAPVPKQSVSLPRAPVAPANPAPPQPARQPIAPVSAPVAVAENADRASPAQTNRGAPDSPGDNPRAKAAEADYYSLLSAHLNRKKKYPTEAKKAMQQGIVTVRFTVDRDGGVTAVSIRKTSGHELLDQATLDLMQRVAPLPRFPRSMTKDSVTISLPIEYSLRTS